jgi:RHS repeat-associated protein
MNSQEGGEVEARKDQRFSPPAVSLPKGGGAIKGIGEKFAANPVTGTGSLSIPLPLSPGRNGFTPGLTLSYDSGSGNGPYGFGWSVAYPSITRRTDRGLPRYLDYKESDVFILSGAEDLVPVLNPDGSRFEELRSGYRITRYRPRIEGLFARIERWTSLSDSSDTFWRSISRENITTFYGRTTASRIVDPSDPTRIFSWLLSDSSDDKGNAAVYEYVAEDGRNVDTGLASEYNRTEANRTANRYLKRVKYGNRTSKLIQPDLQTMHWMFELVVDYGDHDRESPTVDPSLNWPVRPDPFSTYRAGFEVRTYRRCQRFLMFHRFAELGPGSRLVRTLTLEYDDFAYAPGFDTKAELEYSGSTRTGSFLRRATVTGYADDGFRKSMPPLELTYSRPHISGETRTLEDGSRENLPGGVDGSRYHWLDLNSEGLSGVVSEQSGAWWYKPNLGRGRFAPQQPVAQIPSFALSTRVQFLDLAGDGPLDLVQLHGPNAGFFERDDQEGWSSFTPFTSQPNIEWDNRNLRFIDLTGDGHADVLITEDDIISWHPSLAEVGFGARESLKVAADESLGPRLVFDDATETIFLADMSGDGLSDIVRIRNGEVCYWPNLGYGHFGARIIMDNAPMLDAPELFEPDRLHLADIDGSGVVDIIYLGGDGVRLYFNRSGNSWSAPYTLVSFPPTDSVARVSVTDLLGNGTACLVWSSPLPSEVHAPLLYVDLMGGQKPHLLIGVENNLGARTRIEYTSSTQYYLEDQLAGRPWITRLPFPVHVVQRMDIFDDISRNRFVTRFSYHHGYFDGVEREFRGFGLVEQWDTEEFAALNADQQLSPATNIDASSHVPPTFTRTWFHTGVYFGREGVSNFFAGLLDEKDIGEYYREPGLNDEQARRLLLDDTVLPTGLTADEEREACRALKGAMLRQEVYALDGTDKQPHPYSVTEQNFAVRLLQPRGENPHAVFFSHARESLGYHYERGPSDPRTVHALTLEVDEFGNVLRSAAVAYGRRRPNPDLATRDQLKQTELQITLAENRVTNSVETADAYRAPLLCEARSYELTGLTPVAGRDRLTLDELRHASSGATPIAYEQQPIPGELQKRLIEHARTLFRRDDFTGSLPLGQLESLAIPFEAYKLAFTPGLVTRIYGTKVAGPMLAGEGHYVHSEDDDQWWIPSGRVFHSPDAEDNPAAELANARTNFFRPRRYEDPFGQASTVTYDNYDLLITKTRDPLGNTVTVGERDPSGNIVIPGNDYRVLGPRVVTDANGNRAAVSFDAMGMVVGTAVMGKRDETARAGDSLDGFAPDLADADVAVHLANPLNDPHSILAHATTRLIYDLFAYYRTKQEAQPSPNVVYMMARETHDADLPVGEQTKVQHFFTYADGFGREIQKKAQAEPGPVPKRGSDGKIIVGLNGQPEMTPGDVSPRWVGSGWTIFNNKGKPVRQFEPFFTDTHHFEFDVRIGVSGILFYDPAERVVATLQPNHTWGKILFDPWRQETWDANDTALIADPATDQDAGGFFRRLIEDEYLPTWCAARQAGALGPEEQAAAAQTAVHAGTPSFAHADSLGRTFLTVAHNRFKRGDSSPDEPPAEEFYSTRVIFDIEGNQREVIDARDRIVVRYDYDMLGARIHQTSMEAGERWLINDVAGQPMRAWDSRAHQFRSTYDQLRRPAETFLRDGSGPEQLIARVVYGEGQVDPEAKNQRGKPIQLFDQAGVVTTEEYDFKGNVLTSQRRLALEYKKVIDWSVEVPLEPELYASSTRFDALNRPISVIAPDNSVYRPIFNEANLLERVDVNLRGAPGATSFVTNIDYNAKGQRLIIEYGNDVKTEYSYEPLTFRLSNLRTTRLADQTTLQDLSYTYDPAGNITQIEDSAHRTIYFSNQAVTPTNHYTYDALYRLINAEGREHIGQASQPQTTWDDQFRMRLPHPADGQAMRRYAESYEYDAVGNFLQLIHRAANGNWNRSYSYDEPSLIEPSNPSNRLSSTTVGDGTAELYSHDPHGNMISMPHLALMRWDFKDQLGATSRQVVSEGTPETTYYVYDGAGRRVRKVTERQNGSRKSERIYLGGFEVYRDYDGNGNSITLERETLHVMDDKQRIALIETRTQGNDGSATQLIRYQFANHLGSASLELDAAGQIISYEEYYPYGSTSYQAVRNQTETRKRYRYTAMERDEESGFEYHSARYYVPWLGRWLSSDPAGLVGSTNRYLYARDNPQRFTDTNGQNPQHQSGEIGELILEQWLELNGFEIFPDISKRVTGGGIDKIAYDPKTDYVYWIDNKSFTSGSISDASALSVERLGVENIDDARKVLDKQTGFSEGARKAVSEGRITFALSNANSDFNVKFTQAMFTKGWKALDIATGQIVSSVKEFEAARKAIAAGSYGRVGVDPRLRGQRGFATVGSMAFILVSIAGTVYALTQIRSFDDAVQFAEGSAVDVGAFTVGKLITGSSGVGFVLTGLVTMASDQAPPSEEQMKDNLVADFVYTYFSKEEIDNNRKELFRQAKDFLFKTEPYDPFPPPPPHVQTFAERKAEALGECPANVATTCLGVPIGP